MGKNTTPPASPNYAAAAQQQGTANADAARQSLIYSNPNITTPYGSQTTSYTTNPFTNMSDVPNITQTLTPTGQKAVDQQQQAELGLSTLANQQTGKVGDILNTPFSFTGQPQTSIGSGVGINYQGVDPNAYQPNRQPINAGAISPGVDTGQYQLGQIPGGGQYGQAGGVSGGPNLQNSLNESGVAAMPIGPGMTAQNAILSRLEPTLARARTSQETALTNQGLRPGGEAYTNAMTDLGQQENDQRTQAALQGLGLDLSANQQGFGQALSRGQFANDAGLSGYNAQLAGQGLQNNAIGQNFGQGLASAQAANQATQGNFGNQLAAQQAANQAQQQGFNQMTSNQQNSNAALQQAYANQVNNQINQNQAQQQGFNQNLQQGQFANTAQQQQLAQQMALRNLPINEITALLSGSQVQNPQFPGYQGSNVTPAPVMAGAQAQGAWDQNLYNQQVAQQNSGLGGLFGLGGTLLGGPIGGAIGKGIGSLF